MSEPSNIRINPFVGDGGTTTYINLTETHIIPSVSPYVIRLNEVPEKQDPSNIRAVWVDSSTGAVTASALTEVAATPAAGEFHPDYATKADGNDNWNTGLIEFSAVDAGKIVQISYTGMGTLAAVQSNKYPSWYTDRGNGSDGDFMPEADCAIGGTKNYKRVFIKKGITVTVDKHVLIKCQDSFVNLGTIMADGQGSVGGKGESHANSTRYTDPQDGCFGVGTVGYGAGGAGARQDGHIQGGAGGAIGMHIDKYNCSVAFAGGGGGGGGGTSAATSTSGNGGNGGGDIVIIASNVIHKGAMTANGENGAGPTHGGGAASGGGGGGRVLIIADTITNEGTLSAAGGKGGTGGWAGDGADGQNGVTATVVLGAL